MSLNERLFVMVPLIATICNIFLLLAVCGVKKDKLIRAFIGQLGVFTAWSVGSLFMRMQIAPGPEFWYMLSIVGIFLVPFSIDYFVSCYTNEKGFFVRGVLLVSWLFVTVLNLNNVFIVDPHVVYDGVEWRFEYGISAWLVVPVMLAVLTLLHTGVMIARSCRSGEMKLSHFTPMFIGVAVMFVGTLSAMLPQMVSLPVDTFSCTINAICLYYVLYKKHVVKLKGFVGEAPVYAAALLCTSLFLFSGRTRIEKMYMQQFGDYPEYEMVVIAVMLVLATLLVYGVFRFLLGKLLLKNTEEQEQHFREFSTAANKVQRLDELLQLYCDFLRQNFPRETARVFLRDAEGNYTMQGATEMAISACDMFEADHPLICWLQENGRIIRLNEFCRTRQYRAMWESEKQRLRELKANVIVPIVCDKELVALTIFSENEKSSKSMAYNGLVMLESAAAVFAIALNNASLYEQLRKKAQKDPLTNLYNRGYFQENIVKEFEMSGHAQISLLIISFDDFHLYNELYGMEEGDRILKRFSEALSCEVNHRGTVARYGGKEFIVSFPFCAASVALDCAEHAKSWLLKEVMDSGEQTKKFLTFSAGISSYPTSASNVNELFTYASMALYAAKSNGKNLIVCYKQEEKDERIKKSLKSKRALAESCASTIYALTAAIDAKDHYTLSHSNHVAEYASVLAEALGLDDEHIEIVRQAGLLHDIGKIGTPEAILAKESRLTPEEYAIMKQHVEASIAMIRYLPSLNYVIPSVIGHHERWDGKGYPRGLAGSAIPIGARCLCLADSFDAMISKRSYKEAMSVEEALTEIRRNLGTQFDPSLGELFIRLVEEGRIQVSSET